MKTIGIIGGLGPEVTATFYLSVIEKFQSLGIKQTPRIVIVSIPMTEEFDVKLNLGTLTNEDIKLFRQRVLSEVKCLDEIGCDILAIPCNSIHLFSNEIIKSFRGKFVSIIDETKRCIIEKDIKKVGVIGTGITIKKDLYKARAGSSLSIVKPTDLEQIQLANIIYNITYIDQQPKDMVTLQGILERFKHEECQGVILGCTDFSLVLDCLNINMEVFDSTSILVKALVQCCTT